MLYDTPNEMGITVSRMLSGPLMHDLKLIAGKDGVSKVVRWVHMGECLNDAAPPEEGLRGGELIFINVKNVGRTEEELLDWIARLDSTHAAGVVLIGGALMPMVTERVLHLCNELSLPLIRMDEEARLVEVTYNIGKLIFSKAEPERAEPERGVIQANRGIPCRRILTEPSLKGLHLRGGENGLDRIVHWIYMAECLSEQILPEDWLVGHELIFVTGKHAGSTTEELLDLIERFNRLNCAGIVLMENPYLPSVSDEVVELCNRLGMPLFVMDYELKSVEISYIIGQLIVSANERISQRERYAGKLIRGTPAQVDEACGGIYAESGLDIRSDCCMGVLYLGIGAVQTYEDIVASAANVFSEICATYRQQTFTAPFQNLVLFFTKIGDRKRKAMVDAFNTAVRGLRSRYGITDIFAGVSFAYAEHADVKSAYRQAIMACIAARCLNQPLINYSELGIIEFLLGMRPVERLRAYYCEVLDPLIQYDNLNGAALLSTLTVYFANNRSIEKTADELYIHRNTLKYRLQKIEDILKRDLNDVNDITIISICLKIEQLMQNVELLAYLQNN